MNNLDLYFNHPSGEIVETDVIENISIMHPCYYMISKDKLKVSTSAAALIFTSGSFQPNPEFKPNYPTAQFWDNLCTIDKRVFRLDAFERRTPKGGEITFYPKREKISKDKFLNESIKYLKKWVNEIEDKFPDRNHIVYTGGRDSRIIHLIPKKYPKRWHIFSSEPNAPLLKEWLDKNKIPYNKFYTHNNKDNDGIYYKIKVFASDLICNPADIRWSRKAHDISREEKCVFWLGNAGDTLYACRDAPFKADNYRDYFKWQFKQTPTIQGGYHQAIFNITNSPIISVYSAPDLWKNLYQRFEPAEFEGQDLRCELGNRLAERELDYFGDDSSLVPKAWEKDEISSVLPMYTTMIKQIIKLEK